MRMPAGQSRTTARFGLPGSLGPVVGLAAVLAFAAGCDGTGSEPGPAGDADDRETLSDPDTCVGPTSGCACEPEAPPVDCYLEPRSTPEGLVCSKGTMFCRNGRWSQCESIETYTLEPTTTGLVTGPDICNPCNPDCATNTDRPTDSDLTSSNSTDVEYDPSAGGITLEGSVTTGGLTDSDGDGVPDVADDYPSDRTRWNSEDDSGYFHILPYGGPSEIDPLDFMTQVTTADIYFLMDTTGSMGGEISNLRSTLTSGTFLPGCSGGVIGAIRCTIPDAYFGVGRFDDYPVGTYGSGGDVPYEHIQDISSSVSAAQSAVNSMGASGGYDWPESHTQALYSMATGNGLDTYLSSRSCAGSNWGWPCFRPDTIPIVVMFTDAPFHNGPNTAYDYGSIGGGTYCCAYDWWGACISWCSSGGGWNPPTWSESVNALNAQDVKVITVESSGGYSDTRSNARALANLTGSVDSSGSPYVFSISTSGTGLSTAVVDAIDRLANETRFDVSARGTDDPSTAIDERNFIDSINAVGWGPGDCAGMTASTFVQCTPGTIVDFRIEFRNDFVMPTMSPQVFEFYIEVLLDGSVQERIPVRIVVPPEVPTYPPSGSYSRDYDATTFCDIPPQRPEWGTFEWTASTPDDSSIRFELRTASDPAELSSATPVSVNVPPRSDVGSADVGSLLSAAGISPVEPYLRVTAVLFASSDRESAPTLTEFRLQYNCFAAE